MTVPPLSSSSSADTTPLVLVLRLPGPPGAGEADTVLRLPLKADQRTRLRGHRQSACGRDLVLQLPRGAALEPGERLAPASGAPVVRVEAAPEALLLVHAADPLALLQAAYHLGNRHVALEVRAGELRLRADSVLEDLLRQRGLVVEPLLAPFLPEGGAYATTGHSHQLHSEQADSQHGDSEHGHSEHGHSRGGHSHRGPHHHTQP